MDGGAPVRQLVRMPSSLRLRVPVALLALPLLLPSSATAQGRWKEIGRTSVGNPVFVDTRSVRKEGGIVTAAVRARFVKPVKTPKGELTSSRTVAMFDCARKVVAVKENTLYHDEKAKRVFEHRVVGKPGYSTTIKGSLPDIALAHLCAAPKR